MAEELRNVFNEEFIKELSLSFKKEYSLFDSLKFYNLIFQEDWKDLTLKQRMRRITNSLKEVLPSEYTRALKIICITAPQFSGGLRGIIFPDYVEQFGLDYWNESIEALAFLTKYSTAEFAVRSFFLKDHQRMMGQMITWSLDSNEHVRRLASEGSRPRLPWGMAVPSIKQNPKQTLPILNNLKEDPSLYVRKSVANHLNDISYIKPELVLRLAGEWFGASKHTNWIIKHACRSLLKKGNKQALSLFGYNDEPGIIINNLAADHETIRIGESISFSFEITTLKTLPLRVEYGIDYVKSRGERSRKIFHLKTFELKENESAVINRSHSFKNLTTRKHYKGIHTLSIMINGAVKAVLDFTIE
ncbi:hypothetical protein [Metabacillus sp. RGM 3146]|uniref:hypothetical protein n=1 Tax=Metabacillus sp. RGM 3146 TaxID=3401092 RepID=UPI003B9C45DF